MELKKVYPYMVDFTLMAPDCALLAEACEVMVQHAIDRAREKDGAHVEAMGAAFKAAHLAAMAQWCMCHKCKEELERDLAEATAPAEAGS